MTRFPILFLLAMLSAFTPIAQTVGLTQKAAKSLDDGYVLFAPIGSSSTFLIDKCGRNVKTWTSGNRPGQAVYLLPNGNLLRTGNLNDTNFIAGGVGGLVELYDWNNAKLWSYRVSDSLKSQHHDVKALPNGNILIIAWERKTKMQAIANGRDTALVPLTLWSEQVLEVKIDGPTTGTVVWEWHLWDHLVQDFDSMKPNFGVVAASPQLVNLNYNASASQKDWIHLNSIDYNPALDQIMLSCHGHDEIWIIDHSTTTAEAASHTGGQAGKGGDLLYRWGNPAAYDNGTTADQKLFAQHNAHWIAPGLPYQNQIMIFNNGQGRPGGSYSTVEIINPPLSSFNYGATIPFLPTAATYVYNSGNPNNVYAANVSGAQQLSNGNILYCVGPKGTFTEVDSSGQKVWEYVNPVSATGIISQNAPPSANVVFRCSFYPYDFQGFTNRTIGGGSILENMNSLSANCMLSVGKEEVLVQRPVVVFPNPATDVLYVRMPDFVSPVVVIQVVNSLGQSMYRTMAEFDKQSTIEIPIKLFSVGLYHLQLITLTGMTTTSFSIIR